ncbi:hypothetical protein HDF14_002198 [Edaphobacter lichenicola]|uniref:Uncharacterized protein n=1 Tax=Tunturiibacter gelidiferens TaxID=3069689 RepID=A0A9X0QE37_9BACT|nr:hypothetical protein [Edaphobacter lichenicola]
MAMHRLHHFVQDLPLVRHCNAVPLANLTRRSGLVHQHEVSINNKDYRSIKLVITVMVVSRVMDG